MMDNSEKKAQYSQERAKSAEKRSSRSFKSFASTVAATERMKRTSGSGRHKQESRQEREVRSHSKDSRGPAEHTGKDCCNIESLEHMPRITLTCPSHFNNMT